MVSKEQDKGHLNSCFSLLLDWLYSIIHSMLFEYSHKVISWF